MRTGAQILWECLVRQGVTDVFGYPGGAILPAYDAMLEFPIRHVLVRHLAGDLLGGAVTLDKLRVRKRLAGAAVEIGLEAVERPQDAVGALHRFRLPRRWSRLRASQRRHRHDQTGPQHHAPLSRHAARVGSTTPCGNCGPRPG